MLAKFSPFWKFLFDVSMEGATVEDLKLFNALMMPDISGRMACHYVQQKIYKNSHSVKNFLCSSSYFPAILKANLTKKMFTTQMISSHLISHVCLTSLKLASSSSVQLKPAYLVSLPNGE